MSHRSKISLRWCNLSKLISVTGLLLVSCTSGEARTVTADPVSLDSRIESLRPGDTLSLARGEYGSLTITKRDFTPHIRIKAEAAVIRKIVIEDSTGIEIDDGMIQGTGGRSYGILINRSRDIAIRGMRITAAHRGIVIDHSENVAVERNTLVSLISDGINIALSRRVRIAGNSCRDFSPTPGIYAANGERLVDGDHADCIQAWSRPEAPPTSDIAVVGNDISGNMQGIFFGSKVRNGIDDGGFDRVTISGNKVHVASAHGITIEDGRGSVVRDNMVTAVAGASHVRRPGVQMKTVIDIRGQNNIVCDNISPDTRKGLADRPCPITATSR